MRALVIGGLGNFGARICRRLSLERGVDVLATSRHPDARLGPVQTAALDLDSPTFAKDMKALHPDLVIHCAGPFQGQDYRVALASMACKAHYLDIADGRDFVAGFSHAVGPAADAAGCLAITGASTLPALSSAVVDSLQRSMISLTAIEVVIAPGQRAPRGAATVSAVLGYAGQSFLWWQDGKWRTVHGWQQMQCEKFSFGVRHAAACDVPDLELFPGRYAGVQTVTFRAALEVSCQHYALWMIAGARRFGISPSVSRWGKHFNQVGTWLDRFGSDTGGMKVRITGIDCADQFMTQTWELVASGSHGPEIPCMAAVLLANKHRMGQLDRRGAHVCMGILTLGDFEREFARWSIKTRTCEAYAEG
jgi:hypothetical protein